jgi:hypothetical protein
LSEKFNFGGYGKLFPMLVRNIDSFFAVNAKNSNIIEVVFCEKDIKNN